VIRLKNAERQNLKVVRMLAHEQVFNEIKELILNNTWKMGEKIPSETELSEIFGVNRLTIRLAIQKLNTIGITETRNGDGTYVIDFNMKKYIEQASVFYDKLSLIDYVYDFRKIIELECLRLATNNASEDEIEELSKRSQDYTDYITQIKNHLITINDDCILQMAKLDFNFHYMLCRISHNTLLENAYYMAKEPLIQYLKGIIFLKYSKNCSFDSFVEIGSDTTHQKLHNAIKNKDYETGKKLLLNMINYK